GVSERGTGCSNGAMERCVGTGLPVGALGRGNGLGCWGGTLGAGGTTKKAQNRANAKVRMRAPRGPVCIDRLFLSVLSYLHIGTPFCITGLPEVKPLARTRRRFLAKGFFRAARRTSMATKHEQNELLTRAGPGTAMGELFRRYWIPALLSEELPEPDCPPVRVQLLSERLLAFRDSSGRLGLVDEFCA